MKLIVSHAAPDFDALASLALAKLLHPGAVAVVQGGVPPQQGALLALYRDVLALVPEDEVDLSEVAELIVVDTSDPARIAPFDALLGRVPVTVYDHHPRDEGDIRAARGLHLEVGATATLLVLLLRRLGLPLSPELASLALLGVHDDTSSLSYPSSRPEDHEAAAHLLRQGASLGLVGQYLNENLNQEQRQMLAELLHGGEPTPVAGRQVVLAELRSEDFVPGLAALCSRLLELHGAEAAFIVARMEDKTLVVGRADGSFDVGRALAAAFGGGGHPGAGFARSDLSLPEAKARLMSALPGYVQEPALAGAFMSQPVRVARAEATVKDASALLDQHGHSGLPVVGEAGELVGIVTRRALRKALSHGLGHAPVKAFMRAEVVSATPETPLAELATLMAAHGVGRVPILSGDPLRPSGIVTRTDLLRAHHPQRRDLSEADVLARLPGAALAVLEAAEAELAQGQLYLVGGTLRDALLGVSLQDLDLALEGWDAPSLAGRLQRRLGGKLSCHLDFGTCTLTLPGSLNLDLATAREEHYAHPGALPAVSPASLEADLTRRDFTLNALALRLAPGPRQLLDPHGGLNDLRAGCLRTLHPASFREDPTRILRGARLIGRLGLTWEAATRAQIPAALGAAVLGGVSASRLRAELELTLSELQPGRALSALQDVGALSAMFGLEPDAALLARLDAARREGAVPDESYLLALLLGAASVRRTHVLERFHWPRRLLDALARLETAMTTEVLGLDVHARLSEAETRLLAAHSPALSRQLAALSASPEARRIRGQDVLDLGLGAGPAVGRVLRAVAHARRDAHVGTLAEELALATRLVEAELRALNHDTSHQEQE